MLGTTEVQILDAFSGFGVVERVKKIKDYAFVHFQGREDACKAMEAMNGEGEAVLHDHVILSILQAWFWMVLKLK